jgi:hypothetical protein
VSISRHAKEITGRWARSLRPVLNMRESGMQLADRGKNYSGEDFFGYTDPLESVIPPELTEIQKKQEREASGVDP